MKLSEVRFATDLEMPDGHTGRIIRAHTEAGDPRWLTITKEGDCVVVRGHLPGNQYSSNPVDIEIFYAWTQVAWIKPVAPVATSPVPKK